MLQRLDLGHNPQLSVESAAAIATAVSTAGSLADLNLSCIKLQEVRRHVSMYLELFMYKLYIFLHTGTSLCNTESHTREDGAFL